MKSAILRKLSQLIGICAFLIFSFYSCKDEPEMHPEIVLGTIETTATEAVFTAHLTSNADNVSVIFKYTSTDFTNWISVDMGTYSGKQSIELKHTATDLTPGTNYRLRVVVQVDGSLVSVKKADFATKTMSLFNYSMTEDLNNIYLNLSLIPNQDDTKVSVECLNLNQVSLSTYTFPQRYSGTEEITLKHTFSKLEKDTEYKVVMRVEGRNGALQKDTITLTCGVTDYDGNVYHLVTIGKQVWIRENLATTHFLNGDPIPNVQGSEEWCNLSSPAYCYYDNDPENGKIYGCLYNFWVGTDPRGLIEGFHVPTNDDFSELLVAVGGNAVAGKNIKANSPLWTPHPGIINANTSGFSALPAGIRRRWSNGKFLYINELVMFFPSEEAPVWGGVYAFSANFNDDSNMYGSGMMDLENGLSLRLLKN